MLQPWNTMHINNLPPGFRDPAYQDDEYELTDFEKGMMEANDYYENMRELE